ncbi:MAG: DUF2723 domain-containing protein [Anaerolineae bacterium]|nr:DUF2723 domain-containing protein [Anaerolineae bacterium]
MASKRKQTFLSWGIAAGLFVVSLALYASRMAPSIVPGDPGEYQIIAARWGIGHPPGYGFYALFGNLFTHLIPFGSFAWRANLLSAVCGASIVALTYGIGRTLSETPAQSFRGQSPMRSLGVPSILGALLLATGLDLWQHAIHANAHIVTALLAALSLFLLLRWQRSRRDGWLYAFCVVAGLSPVHHPLLVFAFPAYAAFVIAVRPHVLLDWRTLLKMVGFTLIGLAAFLYYPIRCMAGAPPLPGPNDMNTWAGFVRVITAQGLRGNLFQFSFLDMMYRLWDVRVPLGLQFAPPALALALLGLIVLWARRWRSALLLTATLTGIILATVNILQDAMAYLLGPVIVVGVLAGVGIDRLLDWLGTRKQRILAVYAPIAVVALVSLIPLWSTVTLWTRMDLSTFRDADRWLEKVEARFVGQGQNATLLTEWERMTTVWYKTQVEGASWNPQDLQFVHVPAGTTFTQGVDKHIGDGPVYLNSYRHPVAEKYRLLPSGNLWQVLPAWPRELPAEATSVDIAAEDGFEIVGWRLDDHFAQAGDILKLDLYIRMSNTTEHYYLPWAKLGETTYHFTTDSRFNTPWWQPGEIVVERFELPVSWTINAGQHELQVGVRLVDEGRDLTLNNGSTLAPLTGIEIKPAGWRPSVQALEQAVGNLRGNILLRGARINGKNVQTTNALARGIEIRPGKPLRVQLDWESLRPIDENLTVFVQLLDTSLQMRAQHDITPLGGSSPTLLWFPRWRQGMHIADTHLIDVPSDLPPGQYPLVVGMYGFETHKRVQSVQTNGDVEGDWITLAHLMVK